MLGKLNGKVTTQENGKNVVYTALKAIKGTYCTWPSAVMLQWIGFELMYKNNTEMTTTVVEAAFTSIPLTLIFKGMIHISIIQVFINIQ